VAANAAVQAREPEPARPAAPAPAPEAAPIDSALGERWNDCVKALAEQGAVVAMVRQLAQQAGLLRIDDRATPQRWQLLVASEPLRNPALADKLSAALSVWLGQAVVLEVQPGQPTDTPALRDAAERQRRQAAAEALIQADPVVLELMQQFKTARIVPGSIKPV
jgi:DNA polymerase-3 subunit gamma/tau